jgi:uncharacterized protein
MTMTKLLAGAAALALLAGCATGSGRSASLMAIPAAVTAAAGETQPALWAVRDADSTIYLYGTIHLVKPDSPLGANWGGPAARAAMAEATEVWTEIEMDKAKQEAMVPLVAKFGIDAANPLSKKLPAERAEQLKTITKALGAPEGAFDVMKPWLAALTIAVVPMVNAGYDPNDGIDKRLDAAARGAGKTMRWFETAEQQLTFLSGQSEALQLESLFDTMDEYEKGPAILDGMSAAWQIGDTEGLKANLVEEMKAEYPDMYKALFTDRNAAWVDTLSTELAGSGVDFVAVGAGHMIGDDSVIAMLKAKGFKIERITAKPKG